MVIKAELREYKNKHGLQQVRIMISDKGKRSVISTKIFVEAKEWDPVKQRVKNTAVNANIINQALSIQLADIQKKAATEGIAEVLRKKEIKLQDFISEMERRLSERNTVETVGNFRSQAKKLNGFAPGAKLQDITPDFLERYETYCRTELNNTDGGIKNTMRFVSQVVNRGILKGLLPANQIAGYEHKPYKPTTKIHLTREEMNRWQKVLETGELTERERVVGYYYLLSCYTGLRHRDCMRLNKTMKVNGRLLLYTSKTDAPVSLKMNSTLEQLFDKCLSLGKLPKTDLTNRCLPVIAGLAKIDKHISFHVARHSFAVNCAHLGIPIEVTSKLMAHTDLKTTGIYYKLANPVLDEAMKKWES